MTATNFLGQRFGNYELTRLLGEGSFARVYLGEHLYLNTPAAIKILNAQTEDELEVFRAEARTIARLVHPNIVRVLEFGVEDPVPFLVLDYAAAGTVRQRYPKGTLLAIPTVVSYAKQVAEALQYAHEERIVHRDVKPENLLLGRNGEVLLSDFGIALMRRISRSVQELDIAGTPVYMAPEQIRQQPQPASDQYALATVVYEWLAGTAPFNGSLSAILAQQQDATPPPIRATRPSISPAIEQVVMKALNKEPGARYSSVRAFAQALEKAHLTGAMPSRQAILPTTAVPAPGSQPLVFAKGGTVIAPAQFSAPPAAMSFQAAGTLISTYQGHSAAVGSLSWLADGRRILSSSNDRFIQVWDAFTGAQLHVYQDISEAVRDVAGSSDGARIATAGADGLVRVWDVASNRLLSTYRGHEGQNIHALAWAPGQPILATAGSDGTVHVWDATSGAMLAIYRGHTGNVKSLAWSPDANASPLGGGFCLVSGGDDTTVQTWEALTARAIESYRGEPSNVLRVAWSPNVYASSLSIYAPNSSRVACGRENGTVQMWDTIARREVLSYRYSAATAVVAWSPDGQRFACATAAKTVEVWDVNTNLKLVTFTHPAPPRVMAWSPDGHYIASGGGDASLQVWAAPSI